VITVRVARAEPGPGRPADAGLRIDPRGPVVTRLHGFHVVLADDAGHRALQAWLAENPDGTPLPDLLDRPADDIWLTQGFPEQLAVRLMGAEGGNVTGVEIHPSRADIEEVTEQTCTARIELGGPSGTRHVTARLDLGLTLAVAAGAPVLVPDALMDRLAVPAPGGAPLARSGAAGPERAEREDAWVAIVDRRAGRVFHVPGTRPGKRPRFEPRNLSFGEGLDRWDLDSPVRDLAEEAAPVQRHYSAAVDGPSAVLSAASEPRGSAILTQTVFADDYRGATVAFGGEIRAEDVAGQAGLRLEVLRKGWRVRADRRLERTVSVTGGQDWSRREIRVPVPEDTDVIRFGITLTGGGRVWLRNPELRRAGPDDTRPDDARAVDGG
jgi:hypothetical protein